MLTSVLPACLSSKFRSKQNDKRKRTPHRYIEHSERLDAFILRQQIGSGAFGQVFLAETSSNGKEKVFAVKIVRRSKLVKKSTRGFALTEAAILAHVSALGSLFFTQLHETFCDVHNLYIVTDFLPGGSLHSEMTRRGNTMPNDRIVLIAAQLVEALAQLHAARVIHRDIKPDNILLDACGNIVLADFGLSRRFEPELPSPMQQALQVNSTLSVLPGMSSDLGEEDNATNEEAGKPYMTRTGCGTLDYAAPEMLCGESYSFPADIYSFGVIFYKLLFGSMPPFPSSTASMPTHPDLEPTIPLPQSVASVNAMAWDFCTSLLASNPLHRPSAASLRSHPFFAGVSWPTLSARAYVLPSHHAPPRKSLHRRWECGPDILIDRNAIPEDGPSGVFEAAYNGREKMALASRPGEPRKWRSKANGLVCDALETVLQIRDSVVGDKNRVRRRKWAKDVTIEMDVPFVTKKASWAFTKDSSPVDAKVPKPKSSTAAVDGHEQIISPRLSEHAVHSTMHRANMHTLRRVTKRIPSRPRIPPPVLLASSTDALTKHQDIASDTEAEAGQGTHQSTVSLALAQVFSPRLSPSPFEPLLLMGCSEQIVKRRRPVLSRLNTSLPLSRSSSSLFDSHVPSSELNALIILTRKLENVLPPAQSATCPSLAVSLSSFPPTPGPITPIRGNSLMLTMAGEADLKVEVEGLLKPNGLPTGSENSVVHAGVL